MPDVAQRISIEATGLGGRGQRYRVTHNGVPLIESTKNPEFDSARALLARGIVGQVEVWRHGVSFPASRFDVRRAANVTVSETDRDGLRITRWQPATKEDDQTRAVWSEYNPRAATDDYPAGWAPARKTALSDQPLRPNSS